ncbi:BRO family protein [Sutterella wadsworthensis]|jgi:prophage antirepressor-like protein|uniref:BRO family protein n=4 Tax=Sutterella wadsworthensis TaxID=40545 RepID=UPI0013F5D70F|nr:BRO family protein [Sutterella wadsworthensis]
MQALSFSFENNAVRTLGTPETPLFVALDVCGALGHTNPRKAIKDHVDPEDLIKVEIETNGGRQTVNAVNESGLYALIFGSKLDTAKRFKRWVTSEVLPAIRRTGRYETAQSAQISTSEQYEIRKAIKARAKNSSVHYQTVYNALYDYFKIASYKDLRHDQMKAALALIETCTLKPQLPAPTLAEGSVILSAQEAEALLTFIYYVRFLFADVFGKLDGLLRIVDSPLAGSFWDAFHEVSWGRILEILAKHGHDINDMPCYQHWSSCQPKRKAA